MIARVWRGETLPQNAAEYLDYILETGVKELRAVDGNRGIYLLRRVGHDSTELVFISLWESMENIRKFAGPDVDKAVYFPKDKEFLLEVEPNVKHYEVLVNP